MLWLELLTDRPIDAALVGSEMGVLGDRIDDDRLERSRSHFGNVIAVYLSAALY